jgi:hypothetical protein
MHELSAFESRLAAGLEDVAGPRRSIDAIAIARIAASRAPARKSVWSRFSAMIGEGTTVRGRRLGGLDFGRRPLVVVVVIALITALAFGAIAVGSGLVRLTSVLPPSQTLPSVLPPSQTLPIATPSPTSGQPRPAAWASAGHATSLLGHSPLAVRLHDGRVLVMSAVSCGGCKGIAAYIYDRATGSWSTASLMLIPVSGSATLLDDGTVLVAGGGKSGTATQLYDPGSGRWIATGSMTIAHWGPASSSGDTAEYTATLLRDGKVLVAGGATASQPGKLLANAELYDPSTGRWTATGSMIHPRVNHTATLLPDGRVLVAGGSKPPNLSRPEEPSLPLDSAEIYDPQTGTWTSTESMPEPRAFHTATLLSDGTVLVAGGGSQEFSASFSSAEIYDPRTGRWTSAGNMSIARNQSTATLLLDGSVLIAGGYLAGAEKPRTTATAERYDPKAGSWTPTASMLGPRGRHTAVLLEDGTVLVVGGEPSLTTALDSSELFDPGSGN